MFRFNNEDVKRHWCFIVKYTDILRLFLVFPLLALNREMFTGPQLRLGLLLSLTTFNLGLYNASCRSV